jgi:hypothetical protein
LGSKRYDVKPQKFTQETLMILNGRIKG